MRIAFATVAALVAGCAEHRLRPTFPEGAERAPVIHEQSLLGFDAQGDAAVLELVDAEGEPPELALFVLDQAGGPSQVVLRAPADVSRAAAQSVRERGPAPAPTVLRWAAGERKAAELGFTLKPPILAAPAHRRELSGVSGPLSLVLSEGRDPPAVSLLVGEPGHERIELLDAPVAGTSLPAQVYLAGDAVWLFSGSVGEGVPLRRSSSLRRASLARGEARFYEERGIAERDQGPLETARRDFGRAVAADPGFAEALYFAASAAAHDGDDEEAVRLLGRAATADPRRVQVLGRNDPSFHALRSRGDVRAMLGLRRLPPEGVPQAE